MTEPIIFEIPIYRCALEYHAKDLQKIREKNYLEFAGSQNIPEFQDYKLFIENTLCYIWKYNEIVGYLNIYFLGNQFRIEYYFVQNKRINKGIRKKKFIYLGKLIEKDILKLKTSDEIYSSILHELYYLKKYPKFKNKYLDLNMFTTLGKYTDWKKISLEVNRFQKT